MEIKVHLGVDKPIGDTLAGMVRDRLLEKQGSGNAVRYLAVAAQGTATRKRSTARTRAGTHA